MRLHRLAWWALCLVQLLAPRLATAAAVPVPEPAPDCWALVTAELELQRRFTLAPLASQVFIPVQLKARIETQVDVASLLQVEVTDAMDNPVPGTVSGFEPELPSLVSWQPEQPLTAGESYTAHVRGPEDGYSEAGCIFKFGELSFTFEVSESTLEEWWDQLELSLSDVQEAVRSVSPVECCEVTQETANAASYPVQCWDRATEPEVVVSAEAPGVYYFHIEQEVTSGPLRPHSARMERATFAVERLGEPYCVDVRIRVRGSTDSRTEQLCGETSSFEPQTEFPSRERVPITSCVGWDSYLADTSFLHVVRGTSTDHARNCVLHTGLAFGDSVPQETLDTECVGTPLGPPPTVDTAARETPTYDDAGVRTGLQGQASETRVDEPSGSAESPPAERGQAPAANSSTGCTLSASAHDTSTSFGWSLLGLVAAVATRRRPSLSKPRRRTSAPRKARCGAGT